jgi:hypothetical protein
MMLAADLVPVLRTLTQQQQQQQQQQCKEQGAGSRGFVVCGPANDERAMSFGSFFCSFDELFNLSRSSRV